AEGGGEQRDRQGDLQRALAAGHQPAQNVVAVAVGAERVPRTRRQVRGLDVRVDLIGVVNERAQEAADHEGRDQGQAGQAQAVPGKGPERGPAAAPGGRRVRSGRAGRLSQRPGAQALSHLAPSYRTLGSRIAYARSAHRFPATVTTPTSTVMPSSTG